MIRSIFPLLILATATSPAAAQRTAPSPNPRSSPLWLGPTSTIPPSSFDQPRTLDERQKRLVVAWGRVGRCVLDADRAASIALVDARPGSPAALAAAKRLRPRFSACQQRYEVGHADDAAYRRAAVADALAAPYPG